MRRLVWTFLAAAVALAAFGSPARADIISEVEPNNTLATAQNVNGSFSLTFNPNIGTGSGGGFVNTSTTIPHVTILSGPGQAASVDLYRFTMSTPGRIILDIDSSATNPLGGGVPPQNTNFDTTFNLLNSAGVSLFFSDDNGGDPGDTPGVLTGGGFNSRIETGVLPAGDYFVQVQAFASSVVPTNGTYTLHISADGAQVFVPEPATMAVFGLMAVGAGAFVRRRKAA